MGYSPKKGYTYNPMLRVNRNTICPFCESGKKFKKCCLPITVLVVPKEQALKVEMALKQKDLI